MEWQFIIDTNLYTPEEIIENVLVTGCLEASNVTYCGDNTAVGYFTTGQISGFETGIIMGSGPVDAISGVDEGDNIDYDCITEPGIYNDMSSISASNGGSTSIYDMNVIEFDFVPSSDTTIFKFVFASEEYDAYECTAYNDVFAFFVSGPGISGPYSDNAINVALVPGTSTPITISTINNDPSCCVGCNTYYTDVVPSEQLWVQGMTLPIEAVMAGLTPCETYHIKFVVCDAGDGVLNTFVFFQGSSFTSGGDITMNHHSATGVDDQVYEGCQNYFVYSRVDTTTLADSAEVLISISGTVNVNTDLDTILPTQFWLPPGIMSDTIPYTAISDGIAEGTEYLIISLINGCPCNQTTTIVDTIFIFDNFDLQAAIGGDTLICLSQSATISTTVNPAFNPGDISYLWSTAATTNSITVTPNTTTTYFVTIQDPCSQTAILSHTVTVIPTVVAAFTVIPDSVCTNENTTITFTGTAGPSAIYTWNFDGGTVASGSGQGPYQVYWTTAGQPTITLNMNDNGCMGYGEEDITVSQIPTSPFTVVPTIICSGDTLTINYNGNASPAAFYLWDFDGGAVISGSGQGPIQVNWTLPGNHDITLEVKENGCTSLETVITVFNPAPLNIVPSTSNIDCPGNAGQASFDVSGGVSPYIYNWSPNPPPLQMGDYTVTITDQLGCYDTYSFSITSPNPFVYVPAFTNLNCYNDNSGSITTSLTGGSEPYTYKWSHDNLNQFTQDSAVTGLSAGTYYLTITDDSLCTVKDTFYISQPALLVTSITSSTNISCFGDNNGSATAVASGGTAQYTFQWNDPLNQATPQAVNLPAGNYSVTTTDAHSCTATASVTLTQPTLFTSTITGTDVSCYGGSDGTITVSPTGGTTPYFHEWSPQQPNNFNIDGLSAGVYWVTISDAHSCTTLNNYIINEPDSITYIMTSTPVTCFGYNNGTAVITITGGGTPNFTFSWSNGQMFNHPFLSKILAAAGTYTITITDAAGCTLSTSVQITQPAKVMVTVPPTQYMCTNGSKSIYASATGGHPGYTYTWSTNQTTSMITVAPAHTTLYNVFATDILNCTSELAYVKVVVYPPLSFDVTVSSDTICPGEDVTFAAHTVGGESPYIYTLSPGITVPPTFIMHPIATTTYSLTVSDVCETPDETDEVTIYVMVEPSNDFYPSITSGCTPLTVQFNETNDMDNRTFDWDFGDPGGLNHDTQQNPFHIYQNPGDYSVSLTTTSEFGCISLNVMNNLIHVYPSPDAWFTNTPDVADILDPTIHFTNQSTLAYVSNWIFGDGSDTVTAVNPVHQFRAPGEYYPKLIVETEHQCKDSVIGTLIIINDKYTFFAPTAFSPDEDGTNDLFSPKIHGLQQGSYHLYIYDRWGEIIFDTDRYDVDPESGRINYGWDGKAKAGRKAVKPGVYTWFLIYKDLSDIEHVESGSVTVIR
ncbi:MAG: choice-of-anchor L domain-containing protein [Bacteroidia bacterium]|nr:choice-of-anchor L domain-containing protein [Bacteroidia bacterium]